MLQWVNEPALSLQSAGLIPGPEQWVKHLVLPQLQFESQLWLGSDPWSRNFICLGAAKKKQEKKNKKKDGYLLLQRQPTNVSI